MIKTTARLACKENLKLSELLEFDLILIFSFGCNIYLFIKNFLSRAI